MNPGPSSQANEDLSIRAAPAPVRRFSKKALIVVLGTASALVLGSFALAMKSPSRDGEPSGRELYSTSNKPRADGLSVLPTSYAEIPREAPKLGPALPGDLGAPILQAQREGRLLLQEPLANAPVQKTDADADLEALQAEQISAARQSALFFSKNSGSVEDLRVSPQSFQRDPFEVLEKLNFPSGNEIADPNFQDRKEAFLGEAADGAIYNPHHLETPISPWQVMAGTIIPATLLTGINSDLPGQIIGQVTEPVYDSVSGQTLLIPQGNRLMGRYDSVVAYGQSRAPTGIIWPGSGTGMAVSTISTGRSVCSVTAIAA
ncbi:MAG: hypothetical protein Hens3KO_18440 [Henriciella sp.]